MIVAPLSGFRESVVAARALLALQFVDFGDTGHSAQIDQLEGALEALQLQAANLLVASETQTLAPVEYEMLKRADQLHSVMLKIKATRQIQQAIGSGGDPIDMLKTLLQAPSDEVPEELKGMEQMMKRMSKVGATANTIQAAQRSAELQSSLRFFIFACAQIVPIRAVR